MLNWNWHASFPELWDKYNKESMNKEKITPLHDNFVKKIFGHCREEIREIVRELIREAGDINQCYEDQCNEISKEHRMYDRQKKAIKKSWPQEGDNFWYIDATGDVFHLTYRGECKDGDAKRFGNCYKTQEEAEAVRDLRKHEAKNRPMWEIIYEHCDLNNLTPEEFKLISKLKSIKDDWVADNKRVLKPIRKEFPQEGDEMYILSSAGDIDLEVVEDTIVARAIFENGNGFKDCLEAEAVMDLRRHEASCRFTMEDFDGEAWGINVTTGRVCEKMLDEGLEIIMGLAFPTKELAQGRADILKRLAKIRGLI
jgi:hypothetical protein